MKERVNKFLKSETLQKAKPYITAIYVLLLLGVVYHLVFAKRIIPGVKIGSTYVGGKTFDKAKELLKKAESETEDVLILKVDDKQFQISKEEIELEYDIDSSISRAFEVGRTGNIFRDTKDKIAGIFKTLYIGAFYDYEDEILSLKFTNIKGEVNVSASDAKIILNDEGELIIQESSEGWKIVDEDMYNVVVNSFDRMDFSPKNISVENIKPDIIKADLEPIKEGIIDSIKNEVIIEEDGYKWVLDKQQLLSFINYRKENGRVEYFLDNARFEGFADTVAVDVNRPPRGQVTRTNGDIVVDFEITEEGRELDIDAFKEEFEKILFESKENILTSLPMVKVSLEDDPSKYGINQLLGEGVSVYKGSASGRVHNLTLAAERTNGVLVPPGAVYSMNNAVGDISSATGYQTAWIIKGDRTVLGSGGGVCQTSTTLFRAILDSGLPIEVRHAHEYRVYYYEQDMPVGFDAAVFQPSWDLQFKNDTSNYVLVQSFATPEEYSLTFQLYGTSDGRTVKITEPVVTNETPPPPALYQEDDSLPKGVTKQIDFAAWGATSTFERTVRRANGEILFKENYVSNYRPWRAIYLVGTK